MNVNKMFKLAKNASEFSDCRIKMGSVIVHKNKIISVGYNTSKSHPLQKEYNEYRNDATRTYDTNSRGNGLHAEMMTIQHAIKDFNGDLSKCSIFVYSETKEGLTRLSKPCRACEARLKELGINKIYYTTENGYNYENWKGQKNGKN